MDEDYPQALLEFNDRFCTEEACRKYLDEESGSHLKY